ncbi:DUF4309 domain-containing protein [Sinanaerobacter chloroacetimidivorans]|uniref:DUF4309 domain-containing protein n=1 Tax=Sinanaerobacter chloroacetimidivorans TaxID=2818044 RepID=A0A8J7VXP7_9FIRM|nr:DUF4309 domain-containing protein [Sinanaerobacter chloroacetimidivorans]MBR0596674.1 DUF4309 domain-containing protein [Sinanaerobacter chloroacetimidivorans]
MKKWIVSAFLVFVLIFMFYSGNKITIENNGNKNQTEQNLNHTNQKSSDIEDEKEAYNSALELLYKGHMNGIEFGIGADSIEIIERWGEPDEKVNFMGGLLLSYDDIYFLTDGLISNEGITYGKVIGIYYTGEEAIYGIQIGMPLKQLEEILGAPNNTYISQYSELYADNHLIVSYRADKYVADFEIDEQSEMVQSISIWQEEE